MNDLRLPIQFLQAVTCGLGLESDEGLTRVAEELQVGFNPYDAGNFEFALCRGEYEWAASLGVAAGGAGNRSIAQIHNDSVEYLVKVYPSTRCFCAVTGLIAGRTSTLATTDVGLGAFAMDGRYPRPTVPAVRERSQNNAAIPAGFTAGIYYNMIPSVAFEWNLPDTVLLRPGGTLFIASNADNTALVVNFRGSVRRIISTRELAP